MARSLARNTKLFVTTLDDNIGSCTGLNTFEVKVLDGYSFSQDVATQEIGVNESDSSCAGAGLARGTLSFNTALNPVDVSFSTYVRAYDNDVDVQGTAGTNADCVERILWASAMGTEASWTEVTTGGGPSATQVVEAQNADSIRFGLATSNNNSLLDLTLYFNLEQTTYKILNFNVSSAEVDFSIDGIATINWTGQGSRVLEDDIVHTAINGWTARVVDTLNDYSPVPATTTTTFLRNKLSVLELNDNDLYGFDPTSASDETDTINGTPAGGVVALTGTITGTDAYLGGVIYNNATNEWALINANDTTSVTVSDVYDNMVSNWSSGQSVQIWVAAQDDLDVISGTPAGGVINLVGTIAGTNAYAQGRIVNIVTGEWATVVSNNTTSVTVSSSDATLVNGWTGTPDVALYTSLQNAGVVYCIPITGATLTLENNFTYLTPEELAIVNLPLAGFAGNRVISGSFTAYLNTGAMGTGGMLQDMLEKIQESVSNNYHLHFYMGGSPGDIPRVDYVIQHANVSIPTTNVEDLITTEIVFAGKPWDETNNEASFEDTNELTVEYYS